MRPALSPEDEDYFARLSVYNSNTNIDQEKAVFNPFAEWLLEDWTTGGSETSGPRIQLFGRLFSFKHSYMFSK